MDYESSLIAETAILAIFSRCIYHLFTQVIHAQSTTSVRPCRTPLSLGPHLDVYTAISPDVPP
jgi:hypothetical protein